MNQNSPETSAEISDEELRELLPLANQYRDDANSALPEKTRDWLGREREKPWDFCTFKNIVASRGRAYFEYWESKFRKGWEAVVKEESARFRAILSEPTK